MAILWCRGTNANAAEESRNEALLAGGVNEATAGESGAVQGSEAGRADNQRQEE